MGAKMKLMGRAKFFSFSILALVLIPQVSLEAREGSVSSPQRSIAENNGWIVVYKKKETPYEIAHNSLYFVPYGQRLNTSQHPRFSPQDKGQIMIDASISNGFTDGQLGTPYQMILNDGSRVVATLWLLGDHYMMRVFQPSFSKKQVNLLCEFEHFSDEIYMTQNKKGQIEVRITHVEDIGKDGDDEITRNKYYVKKHICKN